MVGRGFGWWVACGVCAASVACGGDDGASGPGGSSESSGDASTSAPTTGEPPASTSSDDTTGGMSAGQTTSTSEEPTSTSSTTDATTDATTGPAPVCGDGSVDPGEQCDDGNQDNSDACTDACTNAVCGDGIVGPGEGCDDGNVIDDDECTNMCAPAGCGDGILGPGEQCDDGNVVNDDACTNTCTLAACGDGIVQADVEQCDDANAVDTDACLSTCVAAACGDNFVLDGVEACDDGNQTNADGCTNTCELPACDDGFKNADETDIDCGGASCDGCALAGDCGSDDDCGVGLCVKGVCTSNKSCKALHDADASLKDGMYMLDPDDGGPNAPFAGFCDMTHNGGGWTLIMKSINTNYHYDDPLWTNALTDNPDDFDFLTDAKRSKYPSFMTVPAAAIRTSSIDMLQQYIHILGAPVASATALFTGPGVQVSQGTLLPYFENMHAQYYKHFNACNPSTKYVNFGINLKDINGVTFLPDGGLCDWNGGARFGLRVNGDHGGTGDHDGQGWGTYTTINDADVAEMTQLLWVR